MHRFTEIVLPVRSTEEGRLARLDVRVKLIVALAAIVAVVLSTQVVLPLGVLACCSVGWIACRTPWRLVILRLVGPLLLGIVVVLLRALMTGSTPLWTWSLGPWELTVTHEGLHDGMLIASRILGAVGVVILLGAVTPSYRIFGALRWLGLPQTWIEIAMLMYRYIFVLFEQASSVRAAQTTRLGYGDFRRSVNSMASLAGIVMLRSLDQAEQSHEAMLARGYEGSLQVAPLPALSRRSALMMSVLVAWVAAAYVAAERCL